MITDLPTPEDYRNSAIECWVQALNKIFDSHHYVESLDLEQEINKQIIEFLQPELRTSIVLLHQGVEAILKSSVCSVSPFLLLNQKRNKWPVLPNQNDKSFGTMFSIGAEDLLYTYCAVSSKKPTQTLVQKIDEIRTLRNEVTHGICDITLYPKNTISLILIMFTEFFEIDSWWKHWKESKWSHPLAAYYDSRSEQAIFTDRLDYILELLGDVELSRHCSFDLNMRYLCPVCISHARNEDYELDSPWANIIAGQEENSLEVICYNCTESSAVCRDACFDDGCHGNLKSVDSNVCLTCGVEQE